MIPLYRKALFRTLRFFAWCLFSAWLFFLFENTEKDDAQVKLQLLRSLYESMASKYNMSIEEFNGFSKVAYEALSEPKRQWSYYEAVDFTFQAFTTIGKVQCEPAWLAGLLSLGFFLVVTG